MSKSLQEDAASIPPEIEELLDRPLEEMKILSNRICNALKYDNVYTLRELLWCSEDDLSKITTLGKKSRKDIGQTLLKMGLSIGLLEAQRPAATPHQWEGEK